MNNEFLTYYQLLDIEPNANQTQIINAYKKKAKLYHPDKNGGSHTANKLFQLIIQAKEVLTDSARRLKYDYMIGVKVKPKPKAKPTKTVEYIPYKENDLGELLLVGALSFSAGYVTSKIRSKIKQSKRKKRK